MITIDLYRMSHHLPSARDGARIATPVKRLASTLRGARSASKMRDISQTKARPHQLDTPEEDLITWEDAEWQ